jgi:hypothetical protein
VNAVAGLLIPIAGAALARRSQAASDEAGREVLRRAGHDPVTLTRQVFADQQDPSWWTRLHAREPSPGARLSAGERLGHPGIAPPQH